MRLFFLNDLGYFLKGLFLTDLLAGNMLMLLFTSVSVKAQDIHLAAFGTGTKPTFELFREAGRGRFFVIVMSPNLVIPVIVI